MKTEQMVVRRAIISETTRNIDTIAKQLEKGYTCDKDLMVAMINRMLAFIDAVVKPGCIPEKENTSVNQTVDSGAYFRE